MPAEKSEVQKGKKPYNPAAMKSDLEREAMGEEEEQVEEEAEEQEEEQAGGEGEEQEEQGEESEEQEEGSEDEAEAEKKKANAERMEEFNRKLEEALTGTETHEAAIDTTNMTETEKALAAKVKKMEAEKSSREVNDALVEFLNMCTLEEREILDPEIRKFLKSDEFKLLAKLPAAKKAAMAIRQARGAVADKLQETTRKKTTEKLEAKRKIEKLSGGPNKKPSRPESIKRKEEANLRKAAMSGDVQAKHKMAGLNDPLLDSMIQKAGGK